MAKQVDAVMCIRCSRWFHPQDIDQHRQQCGSTDKSSMVHIVMADGWILGVYEDRAAANDHVTSAGASGKWDSVYMTAHPITRKDR